MQTVCGNLTSVLSWEVYVCVVYQQEQAMPLAFLCQVHWHTQAQVWPELFSNCDLNKKWSGLCVGGCGCWYMCIWNLIVLCIFIYVCVCVCEKTYVCFHKNEDVFCMWVCILFFTDKDVIFAENLATSITNPISNCHVTQITGYHSKIDRSFEGKNCQGNTCLWYVVIFLGGLGGG